MFDVMKGEKSRKQFLPQQEVAVLRGHANGEKREEFTTLSGKPWRTPGRQDLHGA